MRHVTALKLKHFDECDGCKVCARSKQHKLPFPVGTTNSSIILKMLHMVVWGLYHSKSLSGTQYMLTVVNDYSRSIWTFFMAHKNLVTPILRNFLAMIQNQFDCAFKIICSDNGTEFVNEECSDLFGTLGIINQKSCPYTPQQNGVVARSNCGSKFTAPIWFVQTVLGRKFVDGYSFSQ